MSVHRFLANHRNLIRNATVNGLSTRASNAVFPSAVNRTGNGRVTLEGSYTGQDGATFDVEIRPAGGFSTRVSQPVFAGAGNGTLTDLSVAPGTPSQTVTATLVDLGTETTHAQAVIYGDVLLRAKAAGSGGNALSITVTPAVTLSASPVGALSAALQKDTAEWTDQRHDFGAVPLNPDGTVPINAPRLAFGGNLSRVYRHYKRWDGEQWQYGVSPKLAADFAAGSAVNAVSGTYAVTVTDGVTPEPYTGIATLYDFLLALNASALVEAVGVVAKDLKPGGMAAIDLPIRTVAFALPVVASAPERMPDLQNVVVSAAAPTETVTVECTANTPIGAETWAVKSKVSGALSSAITGARYADTSSPVAFTIPIIPRAEHPISGRIQITSTQFKNAGTETGAPAVCLFKPVLGAKAANKTLTLVWTKKPASPCHCEESAVVGRPDPNCLGVDVEGEDTNMAIPSWYQTRLETLFGWRAGFIAANTAITSAGELRAAQSDIELADIGTSELSACMADLYLACGDVSPASGALTAYDAAMTALDSDLTPLETIGSAAAPVIADLVQSHSYAADAVVHAYTGTTDGITATTTGDVFLVCVAAGTTGTWESFFSSLTLDVGLQVTPGAGGSAVFRVISQDEAYALAGGDAGDINNTAATLSDPGIAHDPATFAKKYRAKMDEVRALAGIVPKSDAGIDGGACWREQNNDHYWQVNGGEYLPVYSNIYWHSCIRQYDQAKGKEVVVSTYEVGFGLRIGCENRLEEGDQVTITIGDVTIDYPYQVGDRYEIPLVSGGPIAFTSGVTGTDTQKWTVLSSLGARIDYDLTAAELPYSDDGLTFTLHRGAIPFSLGDAFSFGVETGGMFRWRKNAFGWSSDTAIADTVALADGLSAVFTPGPVPSFAVGDSYSWRVDQPYSPANLRQPVPGVGHRWTGADQTVAVDLGTVQAMDTVCVALHTLPTSATLTLAGSLDGVSFWTEVLTVQVGPIVKLVTRTARYLELRIVGASGSAIGWWWVGTAWNPSGDGATSVRLARQYSLARGAGINPSGIYRGKGVGGALAWNVDDKDWLEHGDATELWAMLDHVKASGDEPLCFVPHYLTPSEAALVVIDADEVSIEDLYQFQSDSQSDRALSVTLPLRGVIG